MTLPLDKPAAHSLQLLLLPLLGSRLLAALAGHRSCPSLSLCAAGGAACGDVLTASAPDTWFMLAASWSFIMGMWIK